MTRRLVSRFAWRTHRASHATSLTVQKSTSADSSTKLVTSSSRKDKTVADIRILHKSEEKRYTLGIVYEPDTPDTDNEMAGEEEIEKAAWDFMAQQQKMSDLAAQVLQAAQGNEEVKLDITAITHDPDGLDVNHMQVPQQVGTIVESYIARVDMEVGGQQIRKGTWLLGVQWAPDVFTQVKKGELTGLSMYGAAAYDRPKTDA